MHWAASIHVFMKSASTQHALWSGSSLTRVTSLEVHTSSVSSNVICSVSSIRPRPLGGRPLLLAEPLLLCAPVPRSNDPPLSIAAAPAVRSSASCHILALGPPPSPRSPDPPLLPRLPPPLHPLGVAAGRGPRHTGLLPRPQPHPRGGLHHNTPPHGRPLHLPPGLTRLSLARG